ncbi:CHAT domain-containing protein [Streptomyces cyaneofuscatus]|uniref:CHAT domain-containing protein n=1 Tax=Streptomyces cyaneofuscatus TaxID=66883 RepID=UPI003662CC37
MSGDDQWEPEEIKAIRARLAELPREDQQRPFLLNELGSALRLHYRSNHEPALLREGVTRHRDAYELDSTAGFLVNLTNALLDAYEARPDDPEPLEDAYTTLTRALEPGPNSLADDPDVLASLAGVLDKKWDRYGQEKDLLAYVDHHRRAARTAEEQKNPRTARFCARLCDALLDLHTRLPRSAHLDEAAEAIRRALMAAPPGHSDRPTCLNSACCVEEQRFEHDRDVERLRRAEALAEEACSAPREDHGTDRGSYFNTWGNVLRTWNGVTGEPHLLDRAIAAQREAVRSTPPRHPNRAGILANMATTYLRHAYATGDRALLPEAYDLYRKAISRTVGERGAALHRYNLASMLGEFSEVFVPVLSMSEAEVLDLAIEEAQRAVDALPVEDAQRRRYVLGLATRLGGRYSREHRPEDFARTVRLLETNLPVAGSDAETDAETARCCLGIAELWRTRAFHTVAPSDLSAAETVYRQALDARQGAPVELEVHLKYGLATVLVLSAESWIVGGRPFTDAFVARYREATELYRWCALYPDALVQDRIRRAHSWARAAARLKNWREAIEAYRLAFSFVPLLAPQHLARADREELLTTLDGVAADAAACALSMGDPYTALEFLESGRGLFLTESLGLREELAKLDTHAPRLGSRFLQLRAEVAAAGGGSGWNRDDPEAVVEQGFMAPELSVYRARAVELREVLETLRKVPGLTRFLMPPDVRSLVEASADATGPVVVVNVSAVRCDALIVRDGTVRVLPLPELTWYEALRRAEDLQRSTWQASDRALPLDERASAEQELSAVLDWLWRTVARPVLDDLDRPRPASRRRPALPGAGYRRPRVWWCATGPLSGMPLHAASLLPDPARPADTSTVTDSVIDRVVSSYAPTLSVPAYSRDTTLGNAPKVLAVGLKNTPGEAKLAGAHLEVDAVCRWAPDATRLKGEEASRAAVLAGLRTHDWVHFAGHAAQDSSADDNGHLICHDHAAEGPLTTADIADAQAASRSFLAYLAACDTARGRANLTDQAMHLAGGVQSAGFAHVVASFWPLQSTTSLLMTKTFYTYLEGRPVSHDTVARAADHAARAARESSPGRPSWWTSFHHMGP